MEHVQRSGLVDQAASPHKRARERLRDKAEWVLGARRLGRAGTLRNPDAAAPTKTQLAGDGSEGANVDAGRTSGPGSNLSPAALPAASCSAAVHQHSVSNLLTSSTRPRSVSTSTTTSLASFTSDAESETAEDAAVFSTLVAAFPRPPTIRVDGGSEGRSEETKLGSSAPVESPLPSPPLSAASTVRGDSGLSRVTSGSDPRRARLGQACQLRNVRESERPPGPPSIPLPPIPSSPSPSLRPPRSSSFASSSSSSYPPSPSSARSNPHSPSTSAPSTDKPLPPLPPPPIALPPTPPRTAGSTVKHLLDQFAWPDSPSRPKRSTSPEESDESAIDAKFGQRRASSDASSESDSDSDSDDDSLRLENITAELSSLVDSFRPSPSSSVVQTPETSRPASVSPARAREKKPGGERKVSVASSVASRVSRASSARSSAGGSRTGQENTTGGYRAYKLARKPSTSLFPSSSTSSRLNRSLSSSSIASSHSHSSQSSGASSESEELFDLSFDSPPLERERQRGWNWSGSRRKSSATSVEMEGGSLSAGVGAKIGVRREDAGEGAATGQGANEDEEEVLRQSIELAHEEDAGLDGLSMPPAPLRMLHTTRSTPALRRPTTLRPPSMVRRHSDWDIDRIDEEGPKNGVEEVAQEVQAEDKPKGLRPLFTASAATSPSRLPSPTTARSRLPTVPPKEDQRASPISAVKTRPLLTSTSRSMLRPSAVRAASSPALRSRTAFAPATFTSNSARKLSNLPLPSATSALPRTSVSRLPQLASSAASNGPSIPQMAQKGLRRLSSLGTLAYIPSSS